MTETNALATTSSSGAELAFMHDSSALEHLWRLSRYFAASRMVPAHFQQKPEDCMIGLMLAMQLQVNPAIALQNIQVINGQPSFKASYAIGLANTRGPFQGPITWSSEGQGDSLKVTAHATVKATGEVVAVTCSMEMAKAEGWTKNPKYRSIPEQMLRYRSATWLIRLHCPEVLMGLSSSEELEDIRPVTVRAEVSASPQNVVAELNEQIKRKAAAVEVVEAELPEKVEAVEAPADDPF